MATEGLRQKKKEKTRMAILAAAGRLFAELGFDDVTVSAIAEESDVSEATVFNYFGSKEDLFFSGLNTYEERLVDAVRDRVVGESALAAFRDVVIEGAHNFGSHSDPSALALGARIINDSPTLQRRELEILEFYTIELSLAIAHDRGPTEVDVVPSVVAHALMGVHRSLVALVRRLALDGVPVAEIGVHITSQAELAFSTLSDSIVSYGS